jgi:glyceraldehyde-3-phosphate dehydrogenase (ferredoxin)
VNRERMIGQTALLIDLSEASCADAPLDEASSFVGAFDALLDASVLFGDRLARPAQARVFTLGLGPLTGSSIPGCSHLVLATHSLIADAPVLAALAGGGLLLDGIARSPIVLSGCAPTPSALVIHRTSGETKIRLVELPQSNEEASSVDSAGVTAQLSSLLERVGLSDDQTWLISGRAARRTTFGALALMQVSGGKPSAVLDNTPRGGFGSTLWQRHGLGAICLACDREASTLIEQRSAETGALAQRFHLGLSADQLERETGFPLDTRLIDGGTAVRGLETAGSELLCFNATSIYCSPSQRREFYDRVVRPGLLNPLELALAEHVTQHLDCGTPCPLACRKLSADVLIDFESYALLGPQLGVLDHAALTPLIARCIEWGYDVASASGMLGWLFERAGA